MSFIEERTFLPWWNGLKGDLSGSLQKELATPFPRLPYAEAMARYGLGQTGPALRMEIADISGVVMDGGFKVFAEALAKKTRAVLGICVPMPRPRARTSITSRNSPKPRAWEGSPILRQAARPGSPS